MPNRIAILVGSRGRGSNMAAIIKACQSGQVAAEVVLVVAPSPAAPALKVAQELGVKTSVLSTKAPDYEKDLVSLLRDHSVDLVCLAGYMTLLPKGVLDAFPKRVLNIHPALLPKFGGKGMYGMHVHEAVIAAKESTSGCTVHFVSEKYDEGAIILQKSCPVEESDTPESLASKVLKLEHQAYVEAIQLVLGAGDESPDGPRGSNVPLRAPVPHSPHPASFRAVYWLIRLIAWCILFLFGAPMKRKNADRVPKTGPLLVFANHLSNSDPVLIQYSSPRLLHFMARRDIFNMRFLGWLVRWFRAFPVIQSSPDKGAIKQALRYLSEGEAVAVFPEGQLSSNGELGPLFAGAALLVRKSKATVICVGIKGTNKFMPNPKTTPGWAGTALVANWGEPIQFPENTSSVDILREIERELKRLSC
ncbi:phosphoribosylglycinamide formyltransferase [Kamptonema cortianum]|nr:phosphoribosylglycinamide formyltransferase [Geitlerinema splendidum]MDK3157007.1 phosphoribosylglycinamide formyltransferase [Kamptonema cortianum]